MTGDVVDRVRLAVADQLSSDQKTAMLAVSGGVDSMVLLDAALAVVDPYRLRVATFDHGTGPHARAAAELVEDVGLLSGVSVMVGRAAPLERPSEAAWRLERMTFLRAAAAEHKSALFTAHTRDDQIETVLFRLLRGAGPRGLAGLRAGGPIRRPLLGFGRRAIEEYAAAVRLRWVDDPSNVSRAFARNRLRIDVLPALRANTPSIDATLLEIGEQATAWRADADAAVDALVRFTADRAAGTLDVARASLEPFGRDALSIIWPTLLARIGVAADRRGTRRIVEFTSQGITGRQIQLAGGWIVFRRREAFEVRRDGITAERDASSALAFLGDHRSL